MSEEKLTILRYNARLDGRDSGYTYFAPDGTFTVVNGDNSLTAAQLKYMEGTLDFKAKKTAHVFEIVQPDTVISPGQKLEDEKGLKPDSETSTVTPAKSVNVIT